MKRNLSATALFLLLSCALFAQVNTAPFPNPIPQFFDANGAPLSGGKLFTYSAGTTTPLASYTDGTGLVTNTNPVILNASGFPANASGSIVGVWLGPQKYKLILQNSLGVQQWSVDQVGGNNLFSLANLNMAESTAPTCNIGSDILWGDSAGHRFKMCNNNGTPDFVVGQNSVDSLTNKTLLNAILTNPAINSAVFTGTVNLSSVTTVSNLNGTFAVDNVTYACSSVGINAAIAAAILAGGATVDARGCHSLTSFNTEIDVGNASSVPVTLLLPDSGAWVANITDGTSFGIKVFNNSSVVSQHAGYAAFQIQATNTANMGALCGNDTTVVDAHILMEGFNCNIFAGQATMVKAVGFFNGLGDMAVVRNMTFANLSSANVTKTFWVRNSCCGAAFENIVGEAFAISGVTPCWFGDGTTGANLNIKVDGASCVHPGNTASALVDEEWNQFANNRFANVYMEMLTETDTTTPWIAIHKFGTPSAADYFIGTTAGGDVALSTRYDFDIASGAKAVIQVLEHGSVSSNAINDHNGGGTLVTASPNTTIGGYSTEKFIFNSTVQIGSGAAITSSGAGGISASTIGTGTSTSNGTAVGAGVSQAQPAITITGATVTDTAVCSLNAAPVATWQTGIQLLPAVVTANTVTPWLSNPSAGSITPVAAVIRCTVYR